MDIKNEKMLRVASKLYVSWLVLVAACGVLGFAWAATIVVHDSYTAHSALSDLKPYIPAIKIDPSGNTYTNLYLLEDYLNSPDINIPAVSEKLHYFGFSVHKGYNKYEVSINSLWGSPSTSNISTLSNSLWFLIISVGVITVSILTKKWLLWVMS